ncbi:MAG: efflux RND transporter periplasmic adaptor subunit [Candidatus Omnitrophica bacterium]|nr:efflux RND transporter periplasmic adaptor subunit [Candidatus Omnitrophota bacterium]
MRNKKMISFFIAAVIIIAAVLIARAKQGTVSGEITQEIIPVIGSIKTFISCTGTVLPKNRLEVKPPVNGRIDRVLVQEGNEVKTGQILAWMSSTERAALLDAARGKGEETLKYWEDAYKAIPLSAPIDGEVIVATTQPGQTVTTADAVIVLSDRLIVRAQVDETDIGKITPDRKAIISLDAYSDTKIKASVEHIYYESETVNNVTMYKVDLLPEEIPPFFRSGMNATVDFIEQSKENTLLIPADADHKEKTKVPVTLGMSDDKNIEVLSGITANDKIILKTKKYNLPKSTTGTNPFLPSRKR